MEHSVKVAIADHAKDLYKKYERGNISRSNLSAMLKEAVENERYEEAMAIKAVQDIIKS